jgi:MoaA/NifB/PqqE/SkfB family radical SAM enzyme
MIDKYMMGGNKMMHHLDRVEEWKRGDKIAPIHIDAGLSKGCNIRCQYCFGVVQGNFYRKSADVYFPRDALISYVREAGEVGVRSIAFIGEAEPLLNPHVYEAINEGKQAGVDMSLGTNGILLNEKECEESLENLTFIRFNISAATYKDYIRIHASKDFEKAVAKIKFCVDAKRRKNLQLTVGLQMVLTPENVHQAVPLAVLGKNLGVDYTVIKQCSDTITNDIGVYNRLDLYKQFTEVLQEAETHSTDGYDVIVKWRKIQNEGKRNYDQCLGAPFLLYTAGDGKVYSCGDFFEGDKSEEYLMGDLTKNSFKEILSSDRYWDLINKVYGCINVHKECYTNCRTDSINDFLWQIKDTPEHANFV